MNFLAHLYLSKDLPEEMIIGNFIADAVKGKAAYAAFPAGIQKGMDFHREIDHYSDTHHAFRKGAARLYDNHGKFSGIILDIFYDHILAQHWENYHEISLPDFAASQYNLIERNHHWLPEFTKYWFSVMKGDDLLSAYAFEEGIADVLHRMDQRLAMGSQMKTALKELNAYKASYIEEFHVLFKDMQQNLKDKFPGIWL